MSTFLSDPELERLSYCLKAISHPFRLALVCLLLDGEKPVSEIARLTGKSQPSVSQNLGTLANQGILATRKDANWVYYRIADARIFALLEKMRETYCP